GWPAHSAVRASGQLGPLHRLSSSYSSEHLLDLSVNFLVFDHPPDLGLAAFDLGGLFFGEDDILLRLGTVGSALASAALPPFQLAVWHCFPLKKRRSSGWSRRRPTPRGSGGFPASCDSSAGA